jgi:ubiquinone biosynthesis protein COQ4
MVDRSEVSQHTLKTLKGFIALASDVSQTTAVFDIADGLRETDLYQQFIEHAHSQHFVSQVIQERYFSPVRDLKDLLGCPEGSLGHCYASTMLSNGLQPEFYRKLQIEDDYSYIAMRMRETHDIWHIITGFSTDLAGEAGLQAFTLAQMRSPLAVTLLGAFFVNALKSSTPLNPLFEKIQQGWLMGETALPFLAEKWEDSWSRPLSEWRIALKVNYVE